MMYPTTRRASAQVIAPPPAPRCFHRIPDRQCRRSAARQTLTAQSRTRGDEMINNQQWPPGWPRTLVIHKENGDRFNHQDPATGQRISITVGRAEAMLRDELTKLGADRVMIWVDPQRDGVAVYFTHEREPRVMAADRFNSTAANMRSLGLAVEAMRQLKRHGGGAMMDRALAGFAALQPPPPSCWEVLG